MNQKNSSQVHPEMALPKRWQDRLPKDASLSYDYAHVSAMKQEIEEWRARATQPVGLPAPGAAQESVAKLTDEQIKDATFGIYASDYQDDPHGYDIAICRAVERAILAAPVSAPGDEPVDRIVGCRYCGKKMPESAECWNISQSRDCTNKRAAQAVEPAGQRAVGLTAQQKSELTEFGRGWLSESGRAVLDAWIDAQPSAGQRAVLTEAEVDKIAREVLAARHQLAGQRAVGDGSPGNGIAARKKFHTLALAVRNAHELDKLAAIATLAAYIDAQPSAGQAAAGPVLIQALEVGDDRESSAWFDIHPSEVQSYTEEGYKIRRLYDRAAPTVAAQASPWFDSAMDTGIIPEAAAGPVPAIPTDDMCRAAREKFGIGANYADHIYRTMVAAAPTVAAAGAAASIGVDPVFLALRDAACLVPRDSTPGQKASYRAFIAHIDARLTAAAGDAASKTQSAPGSAPKAAEPQSDKAAAANAGGQHD